MCNHQGIPFTSSENTPKYLDRSSCCFVRMRLRVRDPALNREDSDCPDRACSCTFLQDLRRLALFVRDGASHGALGVAP